VEIDEKADRVIGGLLILFSRRPERPTSEASFSTRQVVSSCCLASSDLESGVIPSVVIVIKADDVYRTE